MNPLVQAGTRIVDSQFDSDMDDADRHFIEQLTFSTFDESVDLLDRVDSSYWTEFPVWARNLAYRLASLLEPENVAIRERAAAGMRAFGPDWDEEADRLEAEAVRLRQNSRELTYAH